MNDLLKKALPWIGAAATGNVPALVGMAATAIGDVIGLPVEPNQRAIEAAITTASPEQLLAMKEADNAFAGKMRALGFAHVEELERIASGDRADARSREIKTGDSGTPRWLAAFAVICFVALIYAVLKGLAPAEGMKDTFLILVGAAIAVFKDVYGYYFGSSAGSRDNQSALRQVATKDA